MLIARTVRRIWVSVLLAIILVAVQTNTLRGRFALDLGLLQSLRAVISMDAAERQQASISAIDWLEYAKTIINEIDTLWIALGLVYQLVGDQLAASNAWGNADTSYNSFITKAELHRRSQEYEGAIDWYERALIVRPGDSLAQQRLGGLYHDLGNYAEALSYLQASVTALPENKEARAQLCNTFRSLNNLANVITIYEEAPAMARNDPYLQLCVGKAYWDLVDFSSAAEHFQRAVSLNPNDAALHFWLSLALNRLGNLDISISEAEIAVKMAPSQSGYAEHLLNLYLTKNDWAGASAVADQLLRQDAENSAAKAALEAISGQEQK